jgi:hypothetical protein
MRASRLIFAVYRPHSSFALAPRPFLQRNFCTGAPKQSGQDLSPLSFDNVELHWTTSKSNTVRDLRKEPLPSTQHWTSTELAFFNLHYCQVPHSNLWKDFLCEEAPLTPVAQELTNMKLSLDEIMQGNYISHIYTFIY